jgi:HEPN domain-containing protein
MPREESLYPADWRRIAEKDLRRAEHMLDIRDAEAAGFYLQQAVEKFLPFCSRRDGSSSVFTIWKRC